jgi:hypothetical protein
VLNSLDDKETSKINLLCTVPMKLKCYLEDIIFLPTFII